MNITTTELQAFAAGFLSCALLLAWIRLEKGRDRDRMERFIRQLDDLKDAPPGTVVHAPPGWRFDAIERRRHDRNAPPARNPPPPEPEPPEYYAHIPAARRELLEVAGGHLVKFEDVIARAKAMAEAARVHLPRNPPATNTGD